MAKPRTEHYTDAHGYRFKYCYTCGLWVLLEQFGHSEKSWDRLYTKCKLCVRQYNILKKLNRGIIPSQTLSHVQLCFICQIVGPCKNRHTSTFGESKQI